jgi:hypothetical protein
MTESELHKKLVRLTVALWPSERLLMHRVENVAAIGTFDTFFGTPWGSGWIELKIAGPKAQPQVRPGQPGFGMRCFAAGVPAYILCSSHAGRIRLLQGYCLGSDWRDHQIMEGTISDAESMRAVLLRCVTPLTRLEGDCDVIVGAGLN